MITLFQVALGGAIGAMLRFGVVSGVTRFAGQGFPLGTLSVNVIGSLLMGAAAVALGPRLSPFVMTGILGGFTTFSAFSLDAMRLMDDGRMGAALLYMLLSVSLSVGALWIGMLFAKALNG